jgi:capsid protein
MQDIAEILADTKLTIKVAAAFGLYMKNNSENPGGHDGPRSLSAAIRDETIEEGETVPQEPVTYKVEDFYRSQGGMMNLPKGADIGIIKDERMHPNQVNLIQHLIRDICWGVGVSPDILWDITGLGGANSRIANSDLDRWISCRLLRQKSWLHRFRARWLSAEMEAGRLPYPRGDAKYWAAAYIPQASLTADKGKVGRLNIELVANRMRSLQTHFAEEGLDWERELRQIAKERRVMKDLGIVLDDLKKNPPEPVEKSSPGEDAPPASP